MVTLRVTIIVLRAIMVSLRDTINPQRGFMVVQSTTIVARSFFCATMVAQRATINPQRGFMVLSLPKR